VAAISGMPLPYVLALVGLIGTVYTVMGGVRAVMITDVMQFLILLGGGLLAIGLITGKCGGFSWWPDWGSPELAALQWKEVKVFSLNPFDRVTAVSAIFGACFFWISTATSD
jgi:Na+/proline symporter